MRLFLFAALVLAIIGLVCVAVPTTIAGADWPVWLLSAVVAWFLDQILGSVKVS